MDYQQAAETLLGYMPGMRNHDGFRSLNNVTAGEFTALIYLAKEHDGATAGELTAAIGVGSSRTTAILQSLERKGLLRRGTDPDDGRRVLAFLTDEGKRLEAEQREKALGSILSLMEYLGEEDSTNLLHLMERILSFQSETEALPT